MGSAEGAKPHVYKDKKGFLVKTQDSFIRITKWESPKKLRVGMRFS